MAIKTVSSVDELEQYDERFSRKPNGRLKSNFRSRAEDPTERIREHDRYLEEMRRDAQVWRRDGNIGAAERAENQAAWEQADRVSTFSSRRRDLSSDPDVRDRYHERMLEADADCDVAEQRQYQSDQRHESRWHELHAEQRRERESQERLALENERIMADADKPLRETLKGDELDTYEFNRKEYGKAMNRGRAGDYFDRPGEAELFDQRYRMHMVEWAEAKQRREEQQRARGEEPAVANVGKQKQFAVTGEAAVPLTQPLQAEAAPESVKAEQPKETLAQAQVSGQAGKKEGEGTAADAMHEAQATDGKAHAPLLKEHQGYRAEVSDDQKSIRYMRENDGGLGFIDRGDRVSVAQGAHKTDPDAMRAALTHASEKFEKFRVNGNREQQEAAARMAERLGFGDKLSNPELQHIILQEREQFVRGRADKAIREAKAQSQSGEMQPGGKQVVGPQTHAAHPPAREVPYEASRETQATESRQPRPAGVVPQEPAKPESALTQRADSESVAHAPATRVEEAAPQQPVAEKLREKPDEEGQDGVQAPSRKLAKPAGYDERKRVQVAGERETDSTSAIAKPQEPSGTSEGAPRQLLK